LNIEDKSKKVYSACECKDILLGKKSPKECKLFDKICNPLNPYGPCMVSAEGSCAIIYRYREEIKYG
ncbi:MAG: hydrogenase formation protein HypD, partial [Gottschalkiaceae bacterium]